MKIINIKNMHGFSIIEMIVILAIISMGMIGVLSLTVQSMRVEYINKSTLIASQLAQEGLELARNIRDNNWLTSGTPWNASLVDNTSYAGDYTGSFISISGINDPNAKLKINPQGFYARAGATDTMFSRAITITDATPSSITVSCLVSWSEKGSVHEYRAETILYDWK